MADSSEESDEFQDGNKKDAAKANKTKDYGPEENQEYDATLKALFEKVPPGEGDEFAAVKPWLGAIKEPKSHPKPNKKAPAENLEMDWVYGFRNEDTRMNCFFNNEGAAVYPTAAVGVIFDYKNTKQTYFGGGKTNFSGRKQDDESKDGHSDDVTALCVSFSRKMVASGQNGQQPLIFLWDASTAAMMGKKRLPKGCRLVTAIGISATDQYVAAADAAEKIAVHLFKVDGAAAAIATVQINMKVVHLAFSPFDENVLATAGKDHLAICTLDGKTLGKKMGKGKGGTVDSQCAAAWSASEATKDTIFSGSSSGDVCQWQGGAIVKQYPNNKGSVHSINMSVDKTDGELALVGGNDKTFTIYKFAGGALTKLWAVACDAPPRAVDMFNGNILIGMKNGSIAEMPYANNNGTIKPNVVMTSHCDGEVWGLDIVSLPGGELRMLTSADDNRVLAYNPKTKMVLAEGIVNKPSEKKKKEKGGFKGGASSMSSQPANQQSRCVAYNDTLKHLAVADNKGIVTIRDIDWAQVDQRVPGSLDNVKKTLFKEVKKAEWIETMVFSPDSKHLAVGSHDNTIYLVDTKTYKKHIKLTGHSSFITAIDWAADGSFIRSVCGAYELLFFNIGTKKRDPSGASNTIGTVWSNQTCKLGWNVQGIFPPGCDGSHINSCAMTKDQKLIASGDDYGLVCTYRNPLLDKHASGKYRGHSEHVTTVIWSDDNKYLISTGGQDQTTIQWRVSSGK